MTRAIAFISALMLLPTFYWDAVSMSSSPDILGSLLRDWRGVVTVIVLFYPLYFITGHLAWFVCRSFNFAMHKLDQR